MIPVQPAPEPADFDQKARQSGLLAIAGLAGRKLLEAVLEYVLEFVLEAVLKYFLEEIFGRATRLPRRPDSGSTGVRSNLETSRDEPGRRTVDAPLLPPRR